MSRLTRRWPALLLLAFGAIFLSIGVWIATVGAAEARAAAERAERLRPLGAAGLEDTAIGQDALAEGRIDQRNRARFRDFVAYIRHEYRGEDDDGDDIWVEDERVTPPLLVETGAGLVTVGGAGYAVEGPATRWYDADALRWDGVAGEGTRRYTGLRAGDAVTAIGAVSDGREGRELAAEVVYAGTRADYIAAMRRQAETAPWFGGIFALVGATICVVGVWIIARR
jgi:hypothetical protein